MENINSEIASLADAARYSIEKTASNLFNTSTMLVPHSLSATASAMLNSTVSPSLPLPDYAVLVDRVEKIEENFTHINVAKDQENRICELEGAVTDLMDFMKEQLKLIEEQKKKAQEELERVIALQQHTIQQPQYASSGTYQTTPYPVPNYTGGSAVSIGLQSIQAAQAQSQQSLSTIQKAKLALGLRP